MPPWALAANVVIALATACAPVTTLSAPVTRNVLVLFASTRLLPANIEGDRGMRAVLVGTPDSPIETYAEFLDIPRFHGPAYEQTTGTYLREKYASVPPEVIIAAGDEALRFMLRNRDRDFPGVPIVYVGAVGNFKDEHATLPHDVIGTPMEFDSIGTIDLALRLHPDAERLIIVTGASPWDRDWEVRLRREVAALGRRIAPEFLGGLPASEIRRRLAELGPRAVVVTPGYFADGAGRASTPIDSVKLMAEASSAPVYTFFRPIVGSGVVGGSMPSFERMGRTGGEQAKALLDGVAPASLDTRTPNPSEIHLDWRQVERWGIRESDIPPQAVLDFRTPSLWEAHRNEILAGLVVILLQAGLITALLIERRHRRRTAAALADSETRMNLAARAARLSTWIWDISRGQIAATGRSRQTAAALTARAVEVGQLLATIHPADRERVERAMRRARVEGTEIDVEYRTVRPDGAVRWIAARGRAEKGNGERLLGVALDVTDRKSAELQAAQARTALQHMTRVSVLGQLSASIAHQLNQPLAAILNNAEAARQMLARDGADLGELREICDDIVADERRAAEIIANLRNLFRHGEMQRQPVDINELAQETLALLQSELVMRHAVIVPALAPGLPALLGDRVQLQQVLVNFVLNAAEATASSGDAVWPITVRTDRVGDHVRLCVIDQGRGIAPDDLKRVFEPFWSTKATGMGMGLAICKSIVDAHGGSIAAANVEPHGAMFCVMLPVAPAT